MLLDSLVRVRMVLVGGFVLSCLLLAGCSSKGKLGMVEGKVQVDGVAANGGEVVLTVDGKTSSGKIQDDGTYRVIDVPLGSAAVTVTAPTIPQGGAATPPTKDMPGSTGVTKPVAIPAKYATAATSGKTTTVVAGTNKYDIDLSAK